MSRKVFAILTGIAVGAAAIVGGTYVGLSMERVDQGEVGVVYTMKDGVKKRNPATRTSLGRPVCKSEKLSSGTTATCIK